MEKLLMKQILLLLVFLSVISNASEKEPKMGCILSQKGEVTFNWSEYTDEKYALEDSSKTVKYTAIKKEGSNFREILVGSTIQTKIKGKNLLAKITHIQSKKRIGRGARHGLIEMDVSINSITKTIPFVYFYEDGNLLLKRNINLKEFNLASEKEYLELRFGIPIYFALCAVK
jgi:hypothetical protein